jgi:hypothetical protein
MRILLALVTLAGGVLALHASADAARKVKRHVRPHAYTYSYAQPRYSREQVECERARHADPAGFYTGFPCWARDAFGSGSQNSRGHR